MGLVNPDPLVSTTIPATNISAGASVYAYTATKACRVTIEAYLVVAGGGEYAVWLTKQWAGAGTHHLVQPKMLTTPPSTDLSFTSIPYEIKTGDVISVWVDGLVGDTAVTGGIRITAENPSVLDLTEVVPGSYASGTAGAALGKIGSGQITTVSVVAQDGTVTTWQGDDYDADESRALDWTDSDASWPVLTGATIAVILDDTDTYTGSVVTPTGTGKKVRLELTALQTAAITDGSHSYQVVATLQTTSRIVTLVEGVWISKRRFAE